jgi:hypothetical protein
MMATNGARAETMDPYHDLFDRYVKELKRARDQALDWWDSLLANEKAKTDSPELAERMVRFRWPCGPVSHPRVIAVFRKYFLLCEELNEKLLEEQEKRGAQEAIVIPELAWGVEDEETEELLIEVPRFILIERVKIFDQPLGEFINDLVFVPIGADDRGETV